MELAELGNCGWGCEPREQAVQGVVVGENARRAGAASGWGGDVRRSTQVTVVAARG